MTMILSGNDGYETQCNMYYAVKGKKSIRLEIYSVKSTADIVAMYAAAGYTVSKAIYTSDEYSNNFIELHSFKNWGTK